MKNIFTIIFIFIALLIPQLKAQPNPEVQKNQAIHMMNLGKYGEAIDLLNRYISANPQIAEGYNLRGICYEKRKVYNLAVYDFRSARKLEPNDTEIQQNLSRALKSWRALLLNKIEGHKREIAINPNIPVNYLEIGKSYKNLGDWAAAEEWYDKYLTMEEASADEIIRYSEILAKTNHISKGEPILKRYTEKYPDDHRLWSRYGYFTYWLGKNSIAIRAFKKALELRPYFKEAMDGLDMARGKGYIYTVNDTSTRYNYGMPTQTTQKEYPIDKYYRQIRNNPDDNEIRFKLVKELVKAERYGEAFDQINILMKDKTADTERYEEYWTIVKEKRDSLYEQKIDEYKNVVKSDPANKEAVLKLSQYYAGLQDYDSALEILDKYLDLADDNEVRFRYAKYAAWNYQFEDAIKQLAILLSRDPYNLDYQLLRAQIAVWTTQDSDLAEKYLDNILTHQPDNLQALVSLSSLKIRQNKFASAKNYLDRANELNSKSKEVEAVQIYYDVSLSNYEGLKIYQILFDARELVAEGKCEEALGIYEDYFSKITAPTRLEKFEYANTQVCAEHYKKALDIYNELLDEEYDFEIATQRAKALLWTGDSASALIEFKKLYKERPDDFNAKLNLAVAYEYNHMWNKAEDLYDQLLIETSDSSKIALVEKRKGWLPVTTFGGFLGRFPQNLAVSPLVNIYTDNQDFQFSNFGGRLELGVTNFLTLGMSYINSNLNTSFKSINLPSFKGHIYTNINKNISAQLGIGAVTLKNNNRKTVFDLSAKYEKKDIFGVQMGVEKTDARLVLYSPNMIDLNLNAGIFRLNGFYNHSSGFLGSAFYQHISISDENSANNLKLRAGKEFFDVLKVGYEFYYLDYANQTFFYYSPQDFKSHCIWADWEALKEDNVTLSAGGRLGYIPQGEYFIREIFGEVNFKPIKNLIINGRLTGGSSYKFESSYNYFSAAFSLYWSFL